MDGWAGADGNGSRARVVWGRKYTYIVSLHAAQPLGNQRRVSEYRGQVRDAFLTTYGSRRQFPTSFHSAMILGSYNVWRHRGPRPDDGA